MLMIKAIVRPEKTNEIMKELNDAGFPAVTKLDVVGRGKQRGVKVGDVVYDEIPKELLVMVIRDEDKDDIISTIIKHGKTGEAGTFGDGKIFVTPVEEVYTISTGQPGL
ncbi:P-II family nitrogen regulator [Dethiobacter alkaliphilus]|uniref:Nitrogen regulatory protein P-II n=1 Tax=Dethiobacter alkaliphilus AHT 1 TaxID=555088 RepID=C0GKD7_DETAL|nr:P-II family nitrogen regulator [Dethiobacter alkaliphilus]EEG76180.1 nitrogen regulatory protein P-II [Dethiobacter alkaliphilus AHT 1]MCW3490785.1 P-II family nitrogen regulator [Dethiobacter alkaliphilus]